MAKNLRFETDGKAIAREAARQGWRVENGKGDHAKLYAPDGKSYWTLPLRDLGTGLARKTMKALIQAGLVVTVAAWLWPAETSLLFNWASGVLAQVSF